METATNCEPKAEILYLVICFYFLADLADLMRPSLVAPVVAWLCHEDCPDNGSVIEAAGGWAGKCECEVIEAISPLV